jgi:3',5'-nucleoside bisphosphate phosphatase
MLMADLHNHTTASDGDYTPTELIFEAKKKGLSAVGITDHDTLEGIDEALAAGAKCGIEVIPGVEVSLRFKRPAFVGTLHLLLYFNPAFMEHTERVKTLQTIIAQGRGAALTHTRIQAINEIFGPDGTYPELKRTLTYDDIVTNSNANASRKHMYVALAEKHGMTEDTIFKILGNDSPAYLPAGIDMHLLTPFLNENKMLKVLAHPAVSEWKTAGLYKVAYPSLAVIETLLPELLDTGVNGLEIYYPAHNDSSRKKLLSWADKHRLAVTGGSDCHDTKTRPLGIAGLNTTQYENFKCHYNLLK